MDLALVEGFGRKFCSCGTFGILDGIQEKKLLEMKKKFINKSLDCEIWNTSAFQKNETVSATTWKQEYKVGHFLFNGSTNN